MEDIRIDIDGIDFKNEIKIGANLYQNKYDKAYSHDSIIKGIMKTTDFGISGDPLAKGSSRFTYDVDPLDPSLFKRNTEGYDIAAACNYLHKISYPYYIKGLCGKCAKFVRSGIDVGFGTDPNTTSYTAKHGRPTWAWKYMYFLPKIGFKHITRITRANASAFKPEPGDIAVYMQGGNPNYAGHICMFTGYQWESDFKQNSVFVYSTTNIADIYRFE